MMFIIVFGCIFIFIILNGKEQEFIESIEKIVEAGEEFVHWNFPKLAGDAGNGQPSAITETAQGGGSG